MTEFPNEPVTQGVQRGRTYAECTPDERAAIWAALAFDDDDDPPPTVEELYGGDRR